MSVERNDGDTWRLNYFNYFTEIEEHFQKARGTGLFLLSPLDWALIETWKNSGVPLEAALRGIDASFEKWHAKKKKTQSVNSLAYCTQAVMEEARRMADNAQARATGSGETESPFPIENVRAHLRKAAESLLALTGYDEVASSVSRIEAELEQHFGDLQELDQRLTAIEDKMASIARTRLSDEDLFQMRRQLDNQLRPYRGKMSTDQIAKLEKSFLDRAIYERFGLPRLSLFYVV